MDFSLSALPRFTDEESYVISLLVRTYPGSWSPLSTYGHVALETLLERGYVVSVGTSWRLKDLCTLRPFVLIRGTGGGKVKHFANNAYMALCNQDNFGPSRYVIANSDADAERSLCKKCCRRLPCTACDNLKLKLTKDDNGDILLLCKDCGAMFEERSFHPTPRR